MSFKIHFVLEPISIEAIRTEWAKPTIFGERDQHIVNNHITKAEYWCQLMLTSNFVGKEFHGDDWAYGEAFIKQHQQEFGFTLPNRDIIVDDVRVRGIGKSFEGLEKTVDQQMDEIKPRDVGPEEKKYRTAKVYFEARQQREDTPIYKLEELDVGDRIKGPAILADGTQTIVITPGSSALLIETHVVVNIGEHEVDPG